MKKIICVPLQKLTSFTQNSESAPQAKTITLYKSIKNTLQASNTNHNDKLRKENGTHKKELIKIMKEKIENKGSKNSKQKKYDGNDVVDKQECINKINIVKRPKRLSKAKYIEDITGSNKENEIGHLNVQKEAQNLLNKILYSKL